MKFEALVGIAGILGLVSFSTLIQKIYDTHNTTSLPWTWVALNITAQLQTNIEKEINTFYKHIPLKEETFEGKLNKTDKNDKNKNNKNKTKKNKTKNKNKKTNIKHKARKSRNTRNTKKNLN